MENIDFILWLCLWPIACAVEGYYSAKKRSITGEEPTSLNNQFLAYLIQLGIWVGVANLLYYC